MSSISNDEVINLFKSVEIIKNDSTLSPKQIEDGVEKIHNQIINNLSFLVYNNAKSYRKFSNHEDLIQEGFIGLLKAVRRFDYTKYPNFFLYASQWIKHSIKRSASRFDIVYNPNRKRVVYAERASCEDYDEEDINTPEDVFFSKEVKSKVSEILSEFPAKERQIVERIFGLSNYNPQTLREIGPDFGLTHERIRQIKNNVMLKLKKNHTLNELY